MSSMGSPYFSVSSAQEFRATSSLRSRVTAWACSGSSSMQPTTAAPPKRRRRGTTCSNFSSPSSRLIEFTTHFPWRTGRTASSTSNSVVSTIMGTLTFLTRSSRNTGRSCNSSPSGSCRQTSMIAAPRRTCARPTSAASSNLRSAISRLKRRLPSTLVRSPTSTGRFSSLISQASIPDTTLRSLGAALRGLQSFTASTIARTCSGSVPQHPPTTLSQPCSANCRNLLARRSGSSL